MTRRRRRGRGNRVRLLRRSAFVGIAIGLLVGSAYLWLLDIRVRGEFEGRRWALPARVYARPLELYTGAPVDREQLIAELERLGYARRAAVAEPGTYAMAASRVRLHRRAFRFWDTEEPALDLSIDFDQHGRIEGLQSASGTIDLVRLDAALVGSFYPSTNEDRVLVRLAEVPALLVQALLAVEDRGFYDHHGISPRGIGRALLADLKAGRAVQGGSTLTQQLVKNFYLSAERRMSRKLNEAAMAVLLELHYGKDEILEAYLNEVFLGQVGEQAIHGFAQGSWLYFGRPLEELGPDQLALLAGMVKAPTAYDPRRHPERARQRRDLVLDVLVRQGALDSKVATQAKTEKVVASTRSPVGANRYPHFLDLVRRQLRRDYPEAVLREAGLRLFSTLDLAAQTQVEATLTESPLFASASLEAAVVVADVASGEILAVAGGRNGSTAGFNRALDAVRPIGSLIKPAVYLSALESPQRFNLTTPLTDRPLVVPLDNGADWTPKNADHRYRGQVTLLQGLIESRNVPTVNLGLDLGLDRVADTLRRLGVERRIPRLPSLLLGAFEMPPIEVAQIYLTLATGGFYTPLRAIQSITDHGGRPVNRYPLRIRQNIDPGSAYLITAALQEVARTGTARALQNLLPADVDAAAKTGTSDDTRDSWFAGFTGDKVAVVWLGYDNNAPTGLYGASGAMPLWASIVTRLHPRPLRPFLPATVAWVNSPGQGPAIAAQDASCRDGKGIPIIKAYLPADMEVCGAPESRLDAITRPLRRLRNLFR